LRPIATAVARTATRLHPPVRMLAAEAYPDRSAASKAEYRIKRLTAAAKRAWRRP
jgi:putative endonuclease